MDTQWNITPEELKNNLSRVTLLDVREFPLDEIQLRAESELEKSTPIVIYCAHGVRSIHALMALKSMGYENVRSLQGGLCAWEEQGYPSLS